MGQINSKQETKSSSKQRPALFRALGENDPPKEIQVEDQTYRCAKVFKHDSWAATALYESCDDQPRHKIVCKFNRTQPIGPIPMGWLGNRLANREFEMYHLLADLPDIARAYKDVTHDGIKLTNACVHDFIEGHPLRWHDIVNDDFFDKLDSTLAEMHRRNVAYVDMNKAENVIVNASGDPCLIDFQISQRWPSIWLRAPLRILQRSDLYHSFKLRRRFRPDLLDRQQQTNRIPWWIRVHRCVANPFRACRRRLLVTLRIRHGKGMPQGEVFVEDALKPQGEVFIKNALKADRSAEKSADYNKPILRLYRLLRSPAYAERFETGEQYVNQMLVDLFDGTERHPADKKFIKKTRNASDHNKVVEILKSKAFFLLSQRWNQSLIERKISEIEQSLVKAGLQDYRECLLDQTEKKRRFKAAG